MPSQNDVVRVTAQFSSSAGDIFQWVWHYQQTTAGNTDATDIAVAAAARLTAAWNAFAGRVHASIGGDTLQIAERNPTTGDFDTVETIGIPTLVGTSADPDPANYQDAPVVKFFTNVGRSIGKKFMFGLVDGAFQGQSPSADTLAAMVAFALELNDALAVSGDTLVPGNWNQAAEIFRAWTNTIEANILTGTQDRRRRGIGI